MIVVLSSGEYSEYEIHGLFQAPEGFSLAWAREQYVQAHKAYPGGRAHGYDEQFRNFLVNRLGLIPLDDWAEICIVDGDPDDVTTPE